MPAEALLAADAKRRAAMVAGDTAGLAALLNDDLRWTHSSGRTDDKAAVLDSIESATVQYLSLDVASTEVRIYGDTALLSGVLNGRVRKDAAERDLRNKFLSVWIEGDRVWTMVAWQSTAF